ncbi:MAG: hypothetical protein PHX38_02985 [Sulfuricella sp.]|nr:hypothetical protein [Sulfuricella sp.]
MSKDHKRMLDKVLPDHIAMIETRINEVTLEIVPNNPFQRIVGQLRYSPATELHP